MTRRSMANYLPIPLNTTAFKSCDAFLECGHNLVGSAKEDASIPQVSLRDRCVQWIVSRRSVLSHQHNKAFAVGIKRTGTDARVQVQPCHDDEIGSQSAQYGLELSTGKPAEKTLVHDRLSLARSQSFGASVTCCSFNTDPFIPHFAVRHSVVRSGADRAPDVNHRRS